MKGPNYFAFLGKVFVEPTRTFERLVKEDLRGGVGLMDNRSQLRLAFYVSVRLLIEERSARLRDGKPIDARVLPAHRMPR